MTGKRLPWPRRWWVGLLLLLVLLGQLLLLRSWVTVCGPRWERSYDGIVTFLKARGSDDVVAVMTRGPERRLEFLEPETGATVSTWQLPTGAQIHDYTFLPAGTCRLTVGVSEGRLSGFAVPYELRVIDVPWRGGAEREVLRTGAVKIAESSTRPCRLSVEGQIVAYVERDSQGPWRVVVRNLPDGSVRCAIPVEATRQSNFALSDEGTWLAWGRSAGTAESPELIRVLDTKDGREVATVTGFEGRVASLHFLGPDWLQLMTVRYVPQGPLNIKVATFETFLQQVGFNGRRIPVNDYWEGDFARGMIAKSSGNELVCFPADLGEGKEPARIKDLWGVGDVKVQQTRPWIIVSGFGPTQGWKATVNSLLHLIGIRDLFTTYLDRAYVEVRHTESGRALVRFQDVHAERTTAQFTLALDTLLVIAWKTPTGMLVQAWELASPSYGIAAATAAIPLLLLICWCLSAWRGRQRV